MITRRQANAGILASAAAATPALAAAEQAKAMTLPPRRKDGGESLLKALKLRRSTREYSDRKLPPEVLSDLLWAAFASTARAATALHPTGATSWLSTSMRPWKMEFGSTSPRRTRSSGIYQMTFAQQLDFRTLSPLRP